MGFNSAFKGLNQILGMLDLRIQNGLNWLGLGPMQV